MSNAVAAAEANRRFSELLRRVRQGRTVVITSHGRPVAKMVPVDDRSGGLSGAGARLLARLKAQPVTHAGRWTRDELYDDEP